MRAGGKRYDFGDDWQHWANPVLSGSLLGVQINCAAAGKEERNMDSRTPLEAVLRQDRAVVVFGLFAVAALAWAYTIYLA